MRDCCTVAPSQPACVQVISFRIISLLEPPHGRVGRQHLAEGDSLALVA